jgi:hypothetical protein
MNENERAERYLNAIKRFEEHLTLAPDGTFHLDVEDGKSIGVDDPVVFADLKRSLEETNTKIKRGEIDPQQVELIKTLLH